MLQLLCAAIGKVWALPGENEFIIWFQSLSGEGTFLYYLMNFISMLGEETVLVGIVGLVYWGLDKRRGEQIGFGMISATVLCPLIKNVVCRTRPFDSVPEIHNFRDVDGYSFPSGHSANAAATYFGSALVYRDKHRKWLIATAVILPILVALSRTYLGAHYPTDVICGLGVGCLTVIVTCLLFERVRCIYWVYGGMLAIGFAGFFYCTTSDFFTAYGLLAGFVAGTLFEKKVTRFANTRVWWRIVLRVAVGGGLFVGLNEVIKLIVGAIYPDYGQNVWFERVFRTLRYAVVTFTAIGAYPLLFAQTDKLWRKWGWIKAPADEKDENEQTEPSETQEADA